MKRSASELGLRPISYFDLIDYVWIGPVSPYFLWYMYGTYFYCMQSWNYMYISTQEQIVLLYQWTVKAKSYLKPNLLLIWLNRIEFFFPSCLLIVVNVVVDVVVLFTCLFLDYFSSCKTFSIFCTRTDCNLSSLTICRYLFINNYRVGSWHD